MTTLTWSLGPGHSLEYVTAIRTYAKKLEDVRHTLVSESGLLVTDKQVENITFTIDHKKDIGDIDFILGCLREDGLLEGEAR